MVSSFTFLGGLQFIKYTTIYYLNTYLFKSKLPIGGVSYNAGDTFMFSLKFHLLAGRCCRWETLFSIAQKSWALCR